jgi:translocation and assembly module TamB
VVGSLAASQLKKTLSTKVPLDVLSIEAGAEGFVGARVEAGTYVTDQVYVGYSYRYGADPLEAENTNTVRLEYQISPRWSFEFQYGDARQGSADLIWRKEY